MNNNHVSHHYDNCRKRRDYLIEEVIGEGNIIRRVRWDRHHPNGAELHCISDTGIVTIYNERTGKLVTKLIARPAQISRYYLCTRTKCEVPKYLLDIAYEHELLGYNKY